MICPLKLKKSTHKPEAKWKGINWKKIIVCNEGDKELMMESNKSTRKDSVLHRNRGKWCKIKFLYKNTTKRSIIV